MQGNSAANDHGLKCPSRIQMNQWGKIKSAESSCLREESCKTILFKSIRHVGVSLKVKLLHICILIDAIVVLCNTSHDNMMIIANVETVTCMCMHV